MHRLAAVDAQTYWLSAKMPNDQLLVYGFDGTPTDVDRAVEVGAQLAGFSTFERGNVHLRL